MAQKTGALIFDEQTDRYDIRFDIADYYGGLHCGECFDVFTGCLLYTSKSSFQSMDSISFIISSLFMSICKSLTFFPT